MRRHKGADVAAQPGDFFDDARTEKGVSVFGHHEDGLDSFVELTVHQGELKFKFKVRHGAQPAQDGLARPPLHIFNQQPVERVGLDVFEEADRTVDQVAAFGQGEQRVLGVVVRDRDDDLVKEFRSAFDDICFCMTRPLSSNRVAATLLPLPWDIDPSVKTIAVKGERIVPPIMAAMPIVAQRLASPMEM